jgi:NAD(P)-dependent dehydrogenase (short-subunit alcohol dehydrogenase family)
MAERSAVVLGVGPTRGLGAAIARRFARAGFRVTVMGFDRVVVARMPDKPNAADSQI